MYSVLLHASAYLLTVSFSLFPQNQVHLCLQNSVQNSPHDDLLTPNVPCLVLVPNDLSSWGIFPTSPTQSSAEGLGVSVLSWGRPAAWSSDPCVTKNLTFSSFRLKVSKGQKQCLSHQIRHFPGQRGGLAVWLHLCLLLAHRTCQLMGILTSRSSPSVFLLLSLDIMERIKKALSGLFQFSSLFSLSFSWPSPTFMPPGIPVATYSVRTSMTQHSTLWGGDKSDVMNHRDSRLHRPWLSLGQDMKGRQCVQKGYQGGGGRVKEKP